LGLNGIIFARVVEGSFTAARFHEFISHLLDHMQPFPLPNSVIIMDNARIHKRPEIIEMIIMRGMRVMFLPPYSPNYNPIELAFSSIRHTFGAMESLVSKM
jgi:DDE superfamily endonuclease